MERVETPTVVQRIYDALAEYWPLTSAELSDRLDHEDISRIGTLCSVLRSRGIVTGVEGPRSPRLVDGQIVKSTVTRWGLIPGAQRPTRERRTAIDTWCEAEDRRAAWEPEPPRAAPAPREPLYSIRIGHREFDVMWNGTT